MPRFGGVFFVVCSDLPCGGANMMSRVRVYSKRVGGRRPPAMSLVVDIDRSSVLGNPFEMADETQRDAAVRAHAEWLFGKGGDDMSVIADKYGVGISRLVYDVDRERVMEQLECVVDEVLRSSRGVSLMCWCAPRKCHGDVLSRWLERRIKEGS